MLLLPWALEVCALRENINRKSGASPSPPAGGRLHSCTKCSLVPSGLNQWSKEDQTMFTNQEVTNTAAAADTPQPVPTLTPEAVVEALRAIRAQIGEVAPLTNAQRATLRSRTR